MTAIGVGHGARAEELTAFGAERVVPHLAVLIDSHLRALANGSL
jgi:hypothetical protein